MTLNLQLKHAQMKEEGAESIEYGRGYILHPSAEHSCSITYAPKTILTNIGMLKHEPPCTSVELYFVETSKVGEGSKEELIAATKDGRIMPKDPEDFVAAVENGRVLYLRNVNGVLVIRKKDCNGGVQVDNHVFYTSTQREEAITEIADRVRKCTHHVFSLHNLHEKDLLSIAAFISLQLP